MTGAEPTARAVWADVVDPSDEERYEKIGFGRPGGLGKRPAIVVIDVQKRTVLERYPANCGEAGRRAVPTIAALVDRCRAADVPVFFAYVAPKTDADSSRFAVKFGVLQDVDQEGYEFVPEVTPQDGDVLVPKRQPSAFFGTSLVSYLIDRGVDSLIITGATTSGCVRATAIDAFSYGYRVVIPHDAVFDRVSTSHAVNLFDMNFKYGDVMSAAEVIARLDPLSS